MLSGAVPTVTSHSADFPLEVFTVIMAVPLPFAATFPDDVTVATDVSLLLHAQYVYASSGVSFDVSLQLCPTPRVTLSLSSSIFSGAVPTITSHSAESPLEVLTVIMAVPLPFAEIFPEEFTVATDVSLLLHVQWVSASLGVIV